MKKIFLALAALATLAACTKSEVEYVSAGNEITFAPVAKNITKSMITTSAFPTSESFNVWAWYNQIEKGTEVSNWDTSTDTEYFSEGTFVYREGTDWGGQTPYYWPKVGSLLFAGYYPTSVASKVDYTFDATANKMVFTNIGQGTVASTGTTEDLMYFNMTASSYNNGPVAVVFKHALSWITVNLSRPDENPVDSTTGKVSEYPKIKVNSVTFTNVNNQGTGTVTGTDGTIEWEVNGTAAPTVVTPAAGVVLSKTPAKQAEPLFIPQEFAVDNEATADINETMELQVNYTIYSSAEEYFTETHTTKLNGMLGNKLKTDDNGNVITDSEGNPEYVETDINIKLNSWEPAKRYIYNISIGIEEILIEPTVETWTPIEINVPVQ